MNGVASIFGGLLGYAIVSATAPELQPSLRGTQGHITTGLPQWEYVFLIFGAISLVWAAAFTFFMPDLPSTASFLSYEEKII